MSWGYHLQQCTEHGKLELLTTKFSCLHLTDLLHQHLHPGHFSFTTVSPMFHHSFLLRLSFTTLDWSGGTLLIFLAVSGPHLADLPHFLVFHQSMGHQARFWEHNISRHFMSSWTDISPLLVHHNNFATILSEFRHKSVGIFEEEILLLTCQVSVHGVVGRPALRGGGSKQGRPRPAYSNPLSPLLSLQHLNIFFF